MSTLEQLLVQYGLDSKGQEKVASEQKSTNDEVEQVLESLGLSGAAEGVEKVANQNDNKGDSMGLHGIYEELFGETTPAPATEQEVAQEGTEKVAQENSDMNEGTEVFGELSAHYFESARSAFMDKIASDLESEAGAGEQPMAHMEGKSQLGATMGKQEDPHMPVNHSASGGDGMKAMTGNKSPYSLKEQALKKAILKRMMAENVGEMKD